MNRSLFFSAVRTKPFGKALTQSQVNGLTAILDEWDRRRLTDLRHLAYMMATVFGECGENMQPVREGFKKTDAESRAYVKRKGYKYGKAENGHVYYGRGLVQITWAENYQKMGKILGIDLYNKPDRALELPVAVAIMFEGMTRGTFTGKKLSDYFRGKIEDWRSARRIINRLDRAGEIAGYAREFHTALLKAETSGVATQTDALIPNTGDVTGPVATTPTPDFTSFARFVAILVDAIKKLVQRWKGK